MLRIDYIRKHLLSEIASYKLLCEGDCGRGGSGVGWEVLSLTGLATPHRSLTGGRPTLLILKVAVHR